MDGISMRKTRKKKAYMYMRLGLWASYAECNQKIAEVKQFLESNGYEYDIHKGNVVVDMNDEKFKSIAEERCLRNWTKICA